MVPLVRQNNFLACLYPANATPRAHYQKKSPSTSAHTLACHRPLQIHPHRLSALDSRRFTTGCPHRDLLRTLRRTAAPDAGLGAPPHHMTPPSGGRLHRTAVPGAAAGLPHRTLPLGASRPHPIRVLSLLSDDLNRPLMSPPGRRIPPRASSFSLQKASRPNPSSHLIPLLRTVDR